jgi:hypothetical protein
MQTISLPRLLSSALKPVPDSYLISARRSLIVGGRPRFWVTLLILLLLLIPAGMGQWDFVIAVLIGLIVGNGLSFILGK